MNERTRLPNRRPHEIVEFDHGGFRFVAGLGRFPDGRLAEIFLNASVKTGTEVDTQARDAAVVASIALQHGASPETIRRALMRDRDGAASGALGKLLDLLGAGSR
jgi:ribonucleoside-diphosphate reductase alpha chain